MTIEPQPITEILPEPHPPTVRELAAIRMLGEFPNHEIESAAAMAVRYADELVKALNALVKEAGK